LAKIFKAADVVTVTVESAEESYDINNAEEYNARLEQLREEIICKARTDAEEILAKARSIAENILAEAMKEADKIVKDAEKRATELFEEAMAEGYSQGRQEFESTVREKLNSAEEKARELVDEAYQERNRLLEGMKDEILNLAVSIAEKILKTELDRNEEAFRSIVINALKKVTDYENIKVRLSESDYKKYLSDGKDEIFSRSGNITFIKDKHLKKGDLIIESDSGTIDAGIATQLNQVKTAFGVNP